MAGIYIHIPFCKKKCNYCNFYSVASESLKEGFIDALLMEIELRKAYLSDEVINTIYLGGGTPSLFSVNEVERIISRINDVFIVDQEAEITMEFNPDDVISYDLPGLKKYGVNRISLGVQSFKDYDLQYLSRIHSHQQSLVSIKRIRNAGFQNLSIDLIYGIPGSNAESWEENLQTFFDFDLQHLSAYALTVEERTSLKWMIGKRKLKDVDEDLVSEQFKILQELTSGRDYIHYEISNFARQGYYSKHNSLYWLGGNYLGLGPSAHSYNGESRQWNVSNISIYKVMKEIQSVIKEKEILTKDQKFNEYIMTSLRTIWGIDTEHISNVFGQSYVDHFLKSAQKYIDQDFIVRDINKYTLSKEAKFIADGIASDLFIS
jgi:oxygen-independent coproporphyrinogen-3 oxidase